MQELARKALTAKMVEPQRLSIDLNQRWAQSSVSLAPQPQPPATGPNVAAQTETPLLSPASAAIDVTEIHQAIRAIGPFSVQASSPASNTGAAAIATTTSTVSGDAAAAAHVSEAAVLPDKACNATVHVAAFATDALAATEQLQPIHGMAKAVERLSSESESLDASIDRRSMECLPMYTNAG